MHIISSDRVKKVTEATTCTIVVVHSRIMHMLLRLLQLQLLLLLLLRLGRSDTTTLSWSRKMGNKRDVVVNTTDLRTWMSFPARSLLTSSMSNDDVVAWVETVAGVANVWKASAAESWTPKRVTFFGDGTENFEIANLFLRGTEEDGLVVLFTRGPIANTNALGNTRGVQMSASTWRVSNGKDAEVILNETAVDVSFDGMRVYHVRVDANGISSSFWETILDSSSQPEATEMLTHTTTATMGSTTAATTTTTMLFRVEKGTLASFAWMPHSEERVLAFSNDRGSHGFVGLYVRDSERIVWIDPSADADIAPQWSANGRRLVVTRVFPTRDDDGAYSALDGDEGNRGPDFAIVSVDIRVSADGRGVFVDSIREVFRDTNGFGLATFGYGARDPVVLDDAVLFGTESLSEWLHISRVALSGSTRTTTGSSAEELRPGACEDRSWIFDPRESSIFVSHNCDHVDGRGIGRIKVTANGTVVGVETIVRGTPQIVAGMGGMTLTNDYFAWFASSGHDPSAVYVASRTKQYGNGTTYGPPLLVSNDAQSSPAWYASVVRGNRLVRPRTIVFDAEDGAFRLHGQLFEPTNATKRVNVVRGGDYGVNSAALVYTHGGSERQFFAAWHFSPHYASEYAFNAYLSSVLGFRILSVNYRSGIGYGARFRLCEACMSSGGREYLDVKTAARVLTGEVPFNTTGNGHSPRSQGEEHGTFISTLLPHVSSSNVGIWGSSYGGLNALQAITRDPGTLFSTAVSIAPIVNWISSKRYVTDTGRPSFQFDVEASFPRMWRSLSTGPLGDAAGAPGRDDKIRERQLVAYRASPISEIHNLAAVAANARATNVSPPRLLLVQGDSDEEVPFEETIACVRALRRVGFEPGLLVVPDESHCVDVFPNKMRVWTAAASFFLETAYE